MRHNDVMDPVEGAGVFGGGGMGWHRKTDVRMWGDSKFRMLSAPQPCGQWLWVYLMTGPHTTALPGLSVIGELGLAEALGWSLKAFREAFVEVSRHGMAKADWKSRVVWLPNAIKYNMPESPNVVRSWRALWDAIPECQLKVEAYHTYRLALDNRKGFAEAFAKAFPDALKGGVEYPSANQEQEQEQEQITPLPPSGEVRDLFEAFWKAYPKKTGKGAAEKSWMKIRPGKELFEQMVSAIGQQKTWSNWTDEGGRYIPNPSTWLNQQRWLDEPLFNQANGEMGNCKTENYRPG